MLDFPCAHGLRSESQNVQIFLVPENDTMDPFSPDGSTRGQPWAQAYLFSGDLGPLASIPQLPSHGQSLAGS